MTQREPHPDRVGIAPVDDHRGVDHFFRYRVQVAAGDEQ
jgi:hypothetical protein